MRLISLDELIFGELIEFQMQAGPLFARIRSRAYTYVEVSRQRGSRGKEGGGEGGKKDKPGRGGERDLRPGGEIRDEARRVK